jgi:8-oxo-dGTP diphosphatase
MQDKVLACIFRITSGSEELLVFQQKVDPAAGVPVPAGTVEPSETVLAALWREIEEESGLARADLTLWSRLAVHNDPDWNQRRHVYWLLAPHHLPDQWQQVVEGHGQDEGMVFDYYRVPAVADLHLAAEQHLWLALALDRMPAA